MKNERFKFKDLILDYRLDSDERTLIKVVRNTCVKGEYVLKLRLSEGMVIQGNASRLLINLYIFRLLDYYKIVDKREEYIFTRSYLKGKPKEYMNHILRLAEKDSYFRYGQPEDDFVILLPHFLGEVKEHFYKLAIIVDGKLMTDHSLQDYINGYRSSPAFRDLLDNPPIKATDLPEVVVRKADKMMDKFGSEINISPLSDFDASGVKLNRSQLQMMFQWGLVPNYIRMERMANYIVIGGVLDGYRRPEDLFIDANIARLALSTQKTEVKDPGAISKAVCSAISSVKLNMSDTREWTEDCGSKRYMKFTIKSKKDLKFFRYKIFVNDDGTEDWVDINRKDLIGKTLNFRSILTCDGEDTICAKCYGVNYRFAKDNSIFKVNINDYTLIVIGGVSQGVISIKHFLGGKLIPIELTLNGVSYGMEKFVNERKDLVMNARFDTIIFKPGVKVELVREEEGSYKQTLYLNGERVDYPRNVKWREDIENAVEFEIPNDSVMKKAKDMMASLNKHRATKYKKADFDETQFEGMDVPEQLKCIVEYYMSRLTMPHIIHYEILVRGLTRDMDDPTLNVSGETDKVLFMQSTEIIRKPERAHSISATMPFGYIRNAFDRVQTDIKANEYDLLYTSVMNTEKKEDDLYEQMNDLALKILKK